MPVPESPGKHAESLSIKAGPCRVGWRQKLNIHGTASLTCHAINHPQSKATAMSSKEDSRRTSASLSPFYVDRFDGRLAKPRLTMTVTAQTVGRQAQRPESPPASKE
jgi:hypothetical protein